MSPESAVPDTWSDAEYESHLEQILRRNSVLAYSGWPRLATMLRRARIEAGVTLEQQVAIRGEAYRETIEERAAELGVAVAAVQEIEHGGGYEPVFVVADSSLTHRLDLRKITEQLLLAVAQQSEQLPLVDIQRIENFQRMLRQERSREYDTYRRALESHTPEGVKSWRELAVRAYRLRRAGRQSREQLASSVQIPVAVVNGLESGSGAITHRGFYDAGTLLSRLFVGEESGPINELLAHHHAWLTYETARVAKARSAPFDGWEDSGLPELGVALLDARERRGLTAARLATLCDSTRREIAEAEAGFAQSGSANSQLLQTMMDQLGFTAAQYQQFEEAARTVYIREVEEALAEEASAEPPEAGLDDTPGGERPVPGGRQECTVQYSDSDHVRIAFDLDSGITREGGRDYLLNAPRTDRQVRWSEKGLFTILSSHLPREIGSAPADKYLSVYLRATAIENLATDPHAIDLLESAISQLENSGEKGTLLLRVLPEEFDEDFPHDFCIVAGRYGPRCVAPMNPRRVAPQRRSASTSPGGGHLSQHGPPSYLPGYPHQFTRVSA